MPQSYPPFQAATAEELAELARRFPHPPPTVEEEIRAAAKQLRRAARVGKLLVAAVEGLVDVLKTRPPPAGRRRPN